MPPTTPFWFKQRQCKAEPVGDGLTLKVSGPNLSDAYLRISSVDDRWRGELRQSPDGPVVSSTEAELPNAKAAWNAAFELYRIAMIV